MELEQLIPETVTITKTIKGEQGDREIELTFRPFNVEDESWLKQAFGDKLQEHFEKMNMEVISRMAFHQLIPECKRELMKIKFMDMDEDGKDIEVAKTGPKKIAQLTVGYPEQFEILKTLLKVRGFSMPIIDELSNHIESDLRGAEESGGKKSKAGRKKKKRSIGSKSLT